MPGVFDGDLRYAHYAGTASHNPTTDELLKALERLQDLHGRACSSELPPERG